MRAGSDRVLAGHVSSSQGRRSAARGSGLILRLAALSMSVSIAAGMLQGGKAAFAGPALLSLGGRLGQRLPAVSRQQRFLPLVGNAGTFSPFSMSADPAQAPPAKKPKKVKVRGPGLRLSSEWRIVPHPAFFVDYHLPIRSTCFARECVVGSCASCRRGQRCAEEPGW